MKSLLALWKMLLADAGSRCGISTTQDYKTVLRRFEHEGESFLTISLASFGKDFQKSLDLGFVDSNSFTGFAKDRVGTPLFLGGFLRRVFDASTGRLLDVPCIDSIFFVRQLTLMFEKVGHECSPRRTRAAFDAYIKCEQDVRLADSLLGPESDDFKDFVRISRLLWADLLTVIDSRIYNEGVRPKHGPGATVDKLRGNAKYDCLTWTSRLDRVFPFWENLFASQSPTASQRLDDVTILEPGAEMPVKVIAVPKTLKTPRIIAIEPTCMQMMQQGILAVMMEEIARSSNARNFVMFESQEPNQRLAREGSLKGSLATLDLSEASDRVSNQHVRLLLRNHRELFDSVDATRSRKADVPGHGVQRLAKFASMGSALTFPLEALVFCTIVFIGIERELNRQLSQKDVESFYGKVRVYGDDIIVPVDYVQRVVEVLSSFGMKVNVNKSFWTGKFRESCGRDYYDGVDVSIVRVRSILPLTRRDAHEVISTVSLRNQLDKASSWSLAVEYLDDFLGRLIPFPIVDPESPLLGRHGDWRDSDTLHYDNDLHHPLAKGMVVVSDSPSSPLGESGALWKILLHGETNQLPIMDPDHLAFAGRPRTVRIKTRMARPY